MPLRKSTKVWLLLFAVGAGVSILGHALGLDLGCAGSLAFLLALTAGTVLLVRGAVTLFRLIVRRLALRLAFSYFLIGILPIPLLAMLLFVAAYLVAHQVIATRVHSETVALVREAILEGSRVRTAEVRDGKIARSDEPWLPAGVSARWETAVAAPRAVIAERQVWFVSAVGGNGSYDLKLVPVTGGLMVQALADRTGYAMQVETGRTRRRGAAVEIRGGRRRDPDFAPSTGIVHPTGFRARSDSFIEREWLTAVYIDPALDPGGGSEARGNPTVVVFLARTSPAQLFAQFFAQGIPEIGRVFWIVTLALAATLLFVYLVALSIAFVLVGSIARNVNRLTRAAEQVARGDFSVRVNSRSRDQIGDLARSFDGMAASIQRLLVETAKKERLEAEIAVARMIQQKLLPPAEASLGRFSVLAHFEPVADIGGDYYDYWTLPNGRIAVTIGDVSGHGLPTGLLAAMAKAALSTLLESGLAGAALFARLNDLIYRSTDSRNYMTLSFLASGDGGPATLTNAGQLAPYRLAEGRVEPLALPSFPLGASPRSEFPSREIDFAPGDRLVFVTDGFVEATNSAGEPFGFERLEALLSREAESTAAALRDALLAEIARYTGAAAPEDDRTLLVLSFDRSDSSEVRGERSEVRGGGAAP